MPGLVRRLVVIATVEGLILQPLGQRQQKCLLIKYENHEISSLNSPNVSNQPRSAELYGVVGLLTLARAPYLITILRRESVAQIRGSQIFVITDIALIPITSQSEAEKAIEQTHESTTKGRGFDADSELSDDGQGLNDDVAEDGLEASLASPSEKNSIDSQPGGPKRNSLNVVEDVIGKRGQYGRFTERWFSRKGWSTEKRRAQGMSTHQGEKPRSADSSEERPQPTRAVPAESEQNIEADSSGANIANALLPKLLRTTRMLLGSRSFFFSYDFDITRRIGSETNKSVELPLHRCVDPLFFWNHHLSLHFIEGKHHSFVLPLTQGFVGQRAFTIRDEGEIPPKLLSNPDDHQREASAPNLQEHSDSNDNHDFLLTLISRRSVKRPGLRYLRRGIDDEGDAANFVETEQILSKASWALGERSYSFTQIRGSIPLFFSQSPYSFKPTPIMQHSPETNKRALQKHFTNLLGRYSGVQVALLVDKKGGESELGSKYEESVANLNSGHGIAGKKIDFEWFDFHAVCRGMKFENVALLVKSLGLRLDEFGFTVERGGEVELKQSGVLRANCMDCLDRTNVVQSACGQRALEKQLQREGCEINLSTDRTTEWFNTLWADNGDQISREYSSTAALKGDYTRTRRRGYRGAINDLGLTISRYYNNAINDYFTQAAIDYLMGNVTSQVFEEFEATLENRDPAMSLTKVRGNAIETCSKIVIANQHEDLIGGWTLICPREPNSIRTFPFEECVVLVTNVAVYCVKFDWDVEKVDSFVRVDLQSITGILRGSYITSTLTATATDSEKNIGFVVKYRPGKEDIVRRNTRSLSSAIGPDGTDLNEPKSAVSGTKGSQKDPDLKILAFKAPPARDSYTSQGSPERQAVSEKESINNVCEEIRRAATGDDDGASGFIEESDIISLAQARQSTGLLEQWTHSLKKMVWA